MKKGSIQKALAGLIGFLLSNDACVKLVKEGELPKTLLVNMLRFLARTLPSEGGEWEQVCLNFSSNLQLLGASVAE